MFAFQARLSQWRQTSPGFAIRLYFKDHICYFQAMSLTASYSTSRSPKFICKMEVITISISGEMLRGRQTKTKAYIFIFAQLNEESRSKRWLHPPEEKLEVWRDHRVTVNAKGQTETQVSWFQAGATVTVVCLQENYLNKLLFIILSSK